MGTANVSGSTERSPNGNQFSEFQTGFRGDLVRAGDPEYDDARRIWNSSVDKRPAVIARCREVDDVVTALRFAREQGLTVAVRGVATT